MIDLDFSFSGKLWRAAGESWFFITVPSEISADIKSFTRHNRKGAGKGFGSVRVKVRTGATEWLTSLFPDKKSGCYFLPVKAAVRKSEKLSAGDQMEIALNVAV